MLLHKNTLSVVFFAYFMKVEGCGNEICFFHFFCYMNELFMQKYFICSVFLLTLCAIN